VHPHFLQIFLQIVYIFSHIYEYKTMLANNRNNIPFKHIFVTKQPLPYIYVFVYIKTRPHTTTFLSRSFNGSIEDMKRANRFAKIADEAELFQCLFAATPFEGQQQPFLSSGATYTTNRVILYIYIYFLMRWYIYAYFCVFLFIFMCVC
jgi:hypothetical protein